MKLDQDALIMKIIRHTSDLELSKMELSDKQVKIQQLKRECQSLFHTVSKMTKDREELLLKLR